MENIYRQTIMFNNFLVYFFLFHCQLKFNSNFNSTSSNQMLICRSNSPYETFSDSENDLTSMKNKRNNESTEKCLSTDSLPVKSKRANLLELKERLSASKEQTKNSEQNDSFGEKKCARVVKNLNEFLNFTSLSRSKVMPSDAEPELR